MESSENTIGTRQIVLGPFRVDFEPSFTMLRNIRWNGYEVLRAIYVAVRDSNWNTVLPVVSNVDFESDGKLLRITFQADCQQDEINFQWQGRIELNEIGSLDFEMIGTALSGFRRNRIGFCILHSADCCGLECQIEHADGSIETTAFPHWISPHQPFQSIRSIAHRVTPNLKAQVRMVGDVFEMEDQRNWTDASFKTYSTPLEFPFPVYVHKGTEVAQSVSLRINDSEIHSTPTKVKSDSTFAELRVGSKAIGTLPPIGLGIACHQLELTPAEVSRLRVLELSHLRADLHLCDAGWREQLELSERQSMQLDTGLELAVFLTDRADRQVSTLASALNNLRVPVARLFVFDQRAKSTTRACMEAVRGHFRRDNPNGPHGQSACFPIGAGTNYYFTELNRFRPPTDLADCIAYSINPQVHAYDDRSLVETLAMHGFTVQSSRQFCGALPIHISPVTLRPRFNPNATGPAPETPSGEVPTEVDLRQSTLFAAAWTLGSIKSLSEAGVAGITYYETTGMRGVMDAEFGPRLPEKFSSVRGGVFPLYHLFADLANWTGAEIVPCASSNALHVVGISLRSSTHTLLLLANLTNESQQVRISGDLLRELVTKSVDFRCLDFHNLRDATEDPESFRDAPYERIESVENCFTLPLLPHGYYCLEW